MGWSRYKSFLITALGVLVAMPACDPAPGLFVPPSADSCASCHPNQVAQWRASPHARAAESPVFKALLPHVEAKWGVEARARCVSCHDPGHGDDHGVTCVSCHQAVGHAGVRDGRLFIGPDAPLAGPFSDPQPTSAHGHRPSGLTGQSELCGTCHEVTGPEHFIEPTYSEFVASPAAADGKTCQSCHAPQQAPGQAALGGPDDRALITHRFAAIDPPWGADPDTRAAAADATRALLEKALSLSVTPVAREPGETAAFQVELTHVLAHSAGHAIPTGATLLRAMDVVGTVTDATGATLGTWAVDGVEDASVRPPLIRLGTYGTKSGQPVALPTDADRVQHLSLAPGASESMRVAVGTGLAPFHARFSLQIRAFRPALLEALNLSARLDEIPLITVHIKEATAP